MIEVVLYRLYTWRNTTIIKKKSLNGTNVAQGYRIQVEGVVGYINGKYHA